MTAEISRQQLDQWLHPLADVLRDNSVDAVDIICGGGVSISRGTLREHLDLTIDPAALMELAQSGLGDAVAGQTQILKIEIDEQLDLHVLRAAGPAKQIHLRVLRRRTQNFSLQDLIDRDLLPAAVARFLQAALTARLNLVLGGSLRGEARLLARALLAALPAHERTLHISQRADAFLSQPGVLPVVSSGDTALLNQALELNPDRLLLLHPEEANLRWWLRHAPALPGSLLCVQACTGDGILDQLTRAHSASNSESAKLSAHSVAQILVVLAPGASGQSRLEEVSWLSPLPGPERRRPLWTWQLDLAGAEGHSQLRATSALADALAQIQARGVPPATELLQLAAEQHRAAPPETTAPRPADFPRRPPRIDSRPSPPPSPPPTPPSPAPSPEVDHPVPLPELAVSGQPNSRAMQTIDHDDPGWELEILARAGADLKAADLPLHGLRADGSDNSFDARLAGKSQRSSADPLLSAEANVLGPAETGYLHLEPPPMPAPPPEATALDEVAPSSDDKKPED